MAQHTINRKNRNPDRLQLEEEEAWEMMNKGFRFAEFNPVTETYRLSAPYRLLHNMTRDTITLEQASA